MTAEDTHILSADVHPMRYMRTRPFARQVLQLYRRRVGRRLASIADLETIHGFVVDRYNEAIMRVPRDHRPERATRLVVEESSIAMHVGAFTEWGRNIFLLPPPAVMMLERTDLKGVRSGDVKLPFPAFYIGFGAAFGAGLPGPPNRIDGAYAIEQHNGKLQVIVTSRRLDSHVDRATGWPFTRDLYYYGPLDRSDPEKTFEQVVDEAVSAGEIKTEFEAVQPPPSEVVELSDRTMMVRSVRHETAREHAAFMREGIDAFRRALCLVVNTMCLLATAPNEIAAPSYPSDAPSTLIANVLGSERRARERANAELLDKGFTPIRVLLPSLADPRPRQDASRLAAGREAQSHWRRGHWRRQPVGRGLSSIRLTWIRPTLVRADRGEPASGHIYVMDT